MNLLERWYVHTPERVKTIVAYSVLTLVLVGLGVVW